MPVWHFLSILYYSLTDRIFFLLAKPILKWAGGKQQLLPLLEKHLPKHLLEGKTVDYHEPFLGGAAVFFHLSQNYKFENVYLYDINEDLLDVYDCARDQVEDLLQVLKKYRETYLQSDGTQRADIFYQKRARFNERLHKPMDKLEKSALFIFLNKTCFNGLYRVNSKGEFNAPHGEYKNPSIVVESRLQAVSQSLQKVNLIRGDFSLLEKKAKKPAFIYFDPPYRPLNKSSVFNNYQKQAFGDEEQMRLAKVFKGLSKNHFCLLSNSDPKNTDPEDDFFDELYKGMQIHRVPARRNINAKASGRGNINEVLIKNYD